MSNEPDGLAPVARWRNAVRDSDVTPTARLVAFVISTYMGAGGNGAYPSKQTIANGCGFTSERAVYDAIQRLEYAGLLIVHRSKGRKPHTYQAVVPPEEPGPREPLKRDRDDDRDPLAYLD